MQAATVRAGYLPVSGVLRNVLTIFFLLTLGNKSKQIQSQILDDFKGEKN